MLRKKENRSRNLLSFSILESNTKTLIRKFKVIKNFKRILTNRTNKNLNVELEGFQFYKINFKIDFVYPFSLYPIRFFFIKM